MQGCFVCIGYGLEKNHFLKELFTKSGINWLTTDIIIIYNLVVLPD